MQSLMSDNREIVEDNFLKPKKSLDSLKEVNEEEAERPFVDDNRKIIWKKFIKDQNQRKGFVTLKDLLSPEKVNEFNLMALRLS